MKSKFAILFLLLFVQFSFVPAFAITPVGNMEKEVIKVLKTEVLQGLNLP